jgi:hypothetical protein
LTASLDSSAEGLGVALRWTGRGGQGRRAVIGVVAPGSRSPKQRREVHTDLNKLPIRVLGVG